ncbi:TPA: hypothetical protein HA278_04330 [Candidatus Woesearchaeota archaeon]|nr:hypothetical protein [Candidatus Woesearchaeota archaeon]
MKKTIQKRLALIVELRNYAEQMKNGSVFATDFKVMHLLNEAVIQMQEMLAENLELQEQLKSEKTFKKSGKE